MAEIVTDEFWTSRQRQGHSLHEISYRACFKPQLPEYFIERYSAPGDLVVDPFLGRGTTALQAYLMGRRAAGSDINPLCVMLAEPRFSLPDLDALEERMHDVLIGSKAEDIGWTIQEENLLVFYHRETLIDLLKLKNYFFSQDRKNCLDDTDRWARMICLNRLSGHSPGFFSVRTMPPNQAISVESQRRINEKNDLKPEPKNVAGIVIKKSRSLLRSAAEDSDTSSGLDIAPPILRTASADNLFYLEPRSADLIVTSPPFMDAVDYRKDNWLRCWFAGINPKNLNVSGYSSLAEWRKFVREALAEICRISKIGAMIAFEVGEIRNGKIRLDEETLLAAQGLPLEAEAVMVNQQQFTKTSNLWGVKNNKKGTNTNRVVLFKRIDPSRRPAR